MADDGATPVLNLVGGGRVARTLARLWSTQGVFRIGQVLTRSHRSAAEAVEFIGEGQAIGDYAAFEPAPVWMIATADDALPEVAAALAAEKCLRPRDGVFHVSGLLPSTVLDPLAEPGVSIASVHPLQSFSDPARAVEQFPGTFCAAEGDESLVARLAVAFIAVGGRVARIAPEGKLLYHAGAVIGSNYLVALLEASLATLALAGIDRADAAGMLKPLVAATAGNTLEEGACAALTGPISRGDAEIVASHCRALDELAPGIARLYRVLGLATVAIARAQGLAPAGRLDGIESFLNPPPA